MKNTIGQNARNGKDWLKTKADTDTALAAVWKEKAEAKRLAAIPPSVILCGGKLYSYDTAGALVAVDGEAVAIVEKSAPWEAPSIKWTGKAHYFDPPPATPATPVALPAGLTWYYERTPL